MNRVSAKVKARVVAAFKYHCIEAVQLGYSQMLAEKRYQVDWEEDNLTICLVKTIIRTNFLGQFQISVNYQTPLYDDAMAYEGADALRAPRVDFKFSKFFGSLEYDYYAEAKNLSEKDWVKSTGATVEAYKSRARYIETGIENYLKVRYPEGCLVGYVVNGNEASVVAGLNRLIISRMASPRIGLIVKDSIISLPICYSSDNQSISGPLCLRHLILQLA